MSAQFKRMPSLVMSVTLALTLVPAAALAEVLDEVTPPVTPEEVSEAIDEAVDSESAAADAAGPHTPIARDEGLATTADTNAGTQLSDATTVVNDANATTESAAQEAANLQAEAAHAYTAVETPPRKAVGLAFDSIGCLRKHEIPLPDFELVRGFPFSEFHGWGAQIRPDGLSRVL